MSEPTLPGFCLRRLDGVMEGKKIPGRYGNEVRWALDAEGGRWAMKQESGYQGLLAEMLSWLIGEHLQVPQPACALTRYKEEWHWLSAAIIPATHWHQRYRDSVINRDGLGRMLTLDAIICNEDRHPGNLLVELSPDETAVRVSAIDAGNALVGQITDLIARGLEPPNPWNHAPGLPIGALRDAAMAAAEQARRLSRERLRGWVVEGCAVVEEDRVDPLTDALALRCQEAPALTLRYIELLERRP